jgi:hypothetical protein
MGVFRRHAPAQSTAPSLVVQKWNQQTVDQPYRLTLRVFCDRSEAGSRRSEPDRGCCELDYCPAGVVSSNLISPPVTFDSSRIEVRPAFSTRQLRANLTAHSHVSRLMISSCLALLATASSFASLYDLAFARGAFEAKAKSGKLYVMAMNSNGFNSALFPLGVASRRYVIDYGAGQELMFQEVRNGIPQTIWRLALEEHQGKNGSSGTLRRALAQGGLQVVSRRLTRAQRAALNANVNFVDYSLGAQTDFLRVAFVRKDGTEPSAVLYDPNPIRFSSPFFPIPPEESQLLGYGARAWHGTGKFNITVQRH